VSLIAALLGSASSPVSHLQCTTPCAMPGENLPVLIELSEGEGRYDPWSRVGHGSAGENGVHAEDPTHVDGFT